MFRGNLSAAVSQKEPTKRVSRFESPTTSCRQLQSKILHCKVGWCFRRIVLSHSSLTRSGSQTSVKVCETADFVRTVRNRSFAKACSGEARAQLKTRSVSHSVRDSDPGRGRRGREETWQQQAAVVWRWCVHLTTYNTSGLLRAETRFHLKIQARGVENSGQMKTFQLTTT